MKILFLSQIVPYPPHGGVLQRGYNLIREISKYNTVHLLAYIHPDILKTSEEVEGARTELLKYCEVVEFFPLWVKKSPFHKIVGLVGGAFSSLPFSVLAHKSSAMKAAIQSLSSKESYDVVHFDTLALIQFDPQLRKAAKVLVHHNIESTLMERRADAERALPARKYLHRQAQCLRRYEYSTSKAVSVNVVVSENDGTVLREINPLAEVEVVPNGVDVGYFSPNDGSETMSLIYTGGMNMFANRDAVLYFLKHSWPLIKAEEPGVKFYAVGQDPLKELLDIAATDNQVVVTGYVDDVRPYISQSAVYVVPLKVGGGTRLKILDAMAMKKAIVSTSIGCEGLEVVPGKNIVIADDPGQFAENVLRLLRNPEERKRLGRAARQLVETRYSWENIGKMQQAVYEKVAATEEVVMRQDE
jgi:sugar transferase (PEP-CTERM/EpsH1 system associated)